MPSIHRACLLAFGLFAGSSAAADTPNLGKRPFRLRGLSRDGGHPRPYVRGGDVGFRVARDLTADGR